MREVLIGRSATVLWNNRRFEGQIIDETKNLIIIRTAYGDKKVMKNTSKIIINNQIIQGQKILKRPEDRIKK